MAKALSLGFCCSESGSQAVNIKGPWPRWLDSLTKLSVASYAGKDLQQGILLTGLQLFPPSQRKIWTRSQEGSMTLSHKDLQRLTSDLRPK